MYSKTRIYHDASDKRCTDFSLKMHQKRLSAGLCPNPLVELTALPSPPSWVYQRDRDRGRRKGKRHEGMDSRVRGTEEGGKGGREEGRKRERGEICPPQTFLKFGAYEACPGIVRLSVTDIGPPCIF